MTFNIKTALLAGTAIVAFGALAPAAQAADLTLTGAATWGTAANGMVATPTSGDNVILDANTLTINGSEAGVTTIGAITSTTTGAVTINNAADAAVPITIGSIAITGAGNITQAVTDVTTRNVASTITGNVSTGGALALTNVEPDAAATNAMSIGGTLTVTGTTGLTGGNFAGASTTALSVTGATAFTGAVTVTGGANAAADATLTLSGVTNTFTGGLALANGAAGSGILVLDGSIAQTVTGVISGAGDINVTNTHASGVTLAGNSTHTGTLTVNNNGNNQAITFSGNNASAIALGNNVGADTITANFSGTTQAISGGITGGAAETVNVNFSGGSTITLSAVNSTGIDTTAISGNTTFATSRNYGSTNISVASGSTLSTTAMTVTGAVANSGTLALNGGSVTGAITGTGALDVNASGTITGAITQASADIAAFTLTQGAASGYTVTSTNFSGAGTLALLGGSQTVTGSVTNTTDGQGTVTVSDVAGTTAMVGDLGASTSHSLAALTILDGGTQANVFTTTGNLYVDATTVGATDTLQFLSTTAKTVSGTISGGTVTVGNGTTTSDITFSGASTGLAGMTVSAAAAARLDASATTTGTYTNTGTTYVGVGSVLTGATVSDTGSYVLKATDANNTLAAGDFGTIVDTGGGAATLTASRLTVDVTGDMATGTVQLLTHINTGAATLVDDSIQYTFTLANNGNNTDVTVARATNLSLSTAGSNNGVAASLDGLTATTNTQLMAINDNLAAASTQEAFNEVLEAAGPTADGGAVVGGFNASVQSVDVSNTRLASLRNGGGETGMVAGQTGDGLEGWLQGFGQVARQDRRDNVDGYDADTYGMAAGIDTANILENGTVGVSVSYATTDVDSENSTNTNSDVESYQVSLYGDYDVAPQTYVSGTLGFAWNDIDQTRHNVGGIVGTNAQADYDSNQYIAYMEAGREFKVANSASLTPHILAHYQHINIDDYTESGAGGANLNVDSDNLNILEFGVGAEMAWDLVTSGGSKFRPALNVGYRHDVIGDDVSSTSTFTGGGASFKTDGMDAAQGTFNAGVGLTYSMDNNWSLTADYDYEIKSDYDAHSGFVRAGYKF